MPTSTNSYRAGQRNVSDGNPTGLQLGQAAADKVGFHATTPVIQASAIAAVTGTISLTTTINAILSVVRNKGLIAS